MNEEPLLKQFDQVKLITTKRVSYLSNHPGRATDPDGVWSIVGFVEGDALASKGTALIRIPISDIKKVARYDTSAVIELLRGFNGQRKERSDTEKFRPGARGDS